MGKQISDRMKKILGISILVLLLVSMMVAVVSAQPTRGRDGDRDGWRDGGRNCRWAGDGSVETGTGDVLGEDKNCP